ncbi:YeeE/YedE family protein [Lutibacter sp. HS1-25]|uniref:YeeE/YedE family protein n=2 Tax=Lutibacter sp. HS1-25 TaxID=2485000 RepID=UPI001011A8F0|nr:YeeE/YedE thiosulfate transporter family protein [Lutibacter sp. HS1-25]RXP44986.1 YeeE/YedE family protein [Lutibacter sp. HS1-25]
MEFITQPWDWYVAGPIIALIMFLLYYFGERFGVSHNLETFCSIGGAGRFLDYFKIDWRKNSWNLMFVAGAIAGGFIAAQWLTTSTEVAINPQTIEDLAAIGFKDAGATYLPNEIFGIENMLTLKGFLILLIAGIMVGFGARWAGGCTSGHAIVGLSNLELPSLIAVIGFFIGGLVMTWFILPLIF